MSSFFGAALWRKFPKTIFLCQKLPPTLIILGHIFYIYIWVCPLMVSLEFEEHSFGQLEDIQFPRLLRHLMAKFSEFFIERQ